MLALPFARCCAVRARIPVPPSADRTSLALARDFSNQYLYASDTLEFHQTIPSTAWDTLQMSPPSSNAESTRERERDPNRPLDISAPFHPQHNPYPLPQQQQQYQQYQYSPDPSSHMAGSPNASDDGTRGLVPPSQSFGGVSRAESASSGLSAGTAGREMSGLGYGGVSGLLLLFLCCLVLAPGLGCDYLDSDLRSDGLVNSSISSGSARLLVCWSARACARRVHKSGALNRQCPASSTRQERGHLWNGFRHAGDGGVRINYQLYRWRFILFSSRWGLRWPVGT